MKGILSLEIMIVFAGMFSMTLMLLSAGLALLLVKAAMSNLQLVPKGAQNFMEAYISGVLQMGTDVMGKEDARRYIPLIATIGLFIEKIPSESTLPITSRYLSTK